MICTIFFCFLLFLKKNILPLHLRGMILVYDLYENYKQYTVSISKAIKDI